MVAVAGVHCLLAEHGIPGRSRVGLVGQEGLARPHRRCSEVRWPPIEDRRRRSPWPPRRWSLQRSAGPRGRINRGSWSFSGLKPVVAPIFCLGLAGTTASWGGTVLSDRQTFGVEALHPRQPAVTTANSTSVLLGKNCIVRWIPYSTTVAANANSNPEEVAGVQTAANADFKPLCPPSPPPAFGRRPPRADQGRHAPAPPGDTGVL